MNNNKEKIGPKTDSEIQDENEKEVQEQEETKCQKLKLETLNEQILEPEIKDILFALPELDLDIIRDQFDTNKKQLKRPTSQILKNLNIKKVKNQELDTEEAIKICKKG